MHSKKSVQCETPKWEYRSNSIKKTEPSVSNFSSISSQEMGCLSNCFNEQGIFIQSGLLGLLCCCYVFKIIVEKIKSYYIH